MKTRWKLPRTTLLLALVAPLLGATASAQKRVGYEKHNARASYAPALGLSRSEARRHVSPRYTGSLGSRGVRATTYRGSLGRGTRTVLQRVWIPERTERVWVEPVFELRLDACGNQLRVLISDGFYRDVYRPGYWTTREVPVTRGRCRIVYR